MPRRPGAAASIGRAGLAALAPRSDGLTVRPDAIGIPALVPVPPLQAIDAGNLRPGPHMLPDRAESAVRGPDSAAVSDVPAAGPDAVSDVPRRRRSDTGSGPRLRRILADQSNQPVASGLLHLDPILVALADSERQFRALIEQAADGIVVVDLSGRITLANPRACEMLGCSATEVVGLDLVDTYVPEDRPAARQSLERSPGSATRFERQLLRRDGTTIPVDISVAWLGNGERQLIMRDVTARQRAEDARLAEERRLRSLLRISEVECSSVPELLNVTLAEVVALSDSAFGYIYAYDETHGAFTLHSWSRDAIEASEIGDPTWTYELAKSGIWSEVEAHREPIVVNDLGGLAPAAADRAEDLAGGAEGAEDADDPGRGAPVTRFMTIPVISHDQIVAVVGVANKSEPYTDADVRQLTQIMDVVWKIADRQQAEDRLRQFAEQLESRVEQRTHEFERANAELEAANLEIAAANGELQRLLREQERLQGELAYRVLHDPLTGLANRTMFQERLEHASRTSERGIAVLWVDLDHFKEVNDIFGHEVGDEMLIAVADRLRDVVRDTDDIARMGGDEFAIVLPNVVESEAQMVGERVLAALTDRDAFRLQVGASVGIGWQRNVGDDGRVLIRRADQAMYRAKAAGGGRSLMY